MMEQTKKRSRMRMITLRVTDDQHTEIVMTAHRENMTLNAYVMLRLGYQTPLVLRGRRSPKIKTNE